MTNPKKISHEAPGKFEVSRFEKIHSVTIGTLRMPNNFFKKLIKNYPNEHNLFSETKQQKKLTTYNEDLNEEILSFCKEKINSYIDEEKLYINN